MQMLLRVVWTTLLVLGVTRLGWSDHPETDPSVAAKDPDFLVQGEYTGAPESDAPKAMQVIALGGGEFEIAVYEGGLPGAGWNKVAPRRLKEVDEGTVLDLVDSMKLQRVQRKSPTLGMAPPPDAIVLFDGRNQSLKNWIGGEMSDSGFLKQGTSSKQTFRDYSLHLEFRTPWLPAKRGQGRGNSGVYHQGRYETQVLDSFGLEGKRNEAGGIYSIRDPDLNMCFPPLFWQTYDVDFTAARYDGNKKIADARMTVRLNGVVVQNDVALTHATTAAKLKEGPEPGPIYLQDHSNQVRYRNIWVLPRDAEREAARPIVPGFERFFANHVDQHADGGRLLISSLACNACHAGEGGVLPDQRGPDLTAVRSRIRGDALVAMIENPHQTKTGTTMPDPWVGADADERKQNALDIASYLTLRGSGDRVDRPTSKRLADEGKRLYHSIGCVACHAAMDGSATPAATDVPLGNIAKKYTAVSLAQFLTHPHDVRPGVRMPSVVGSESNAYAIASFLTRDVTQREINAEFQRTIYRGSWDNLPDFDSLAPVSSDTVSGLKFRDLRPTTNYGVVFEASVRIQKSGKHKIFLSSDDGSRIVMGDNQLTNDGVHPRTTVRGEFELTAGVHPVRVELFNKGGGAELDVEIEDLVFGRVKLTELIVDPNKPLATDLLPSQFVADSSRVARGEKLFRTSGCAQCHAFGTVKASDSFARPISALANFDGCLSKDVKAPAVDYKLTRVQRSAIRSAIEASNNADEPTDRRRVHLTMAGLNCYACHRRDGIGGPEPSRDPYFETTIPEMGLEGRLPPPLTGVGDKLNDHYFAGVLQNGAHERPYMRTRMPGYRYEPLRQFHESVNRLDRRHEMQVPDHSDTPTQIISAGRSVVGNRGLACIKCHRYDNEKGGGIGAIDLLKMPGRLRESWFHRYLTDPQAYRPGTRMPNAFVDGRSTLTKLYDGDPSRQINAMWQYLKKGTEAKEPEGLKQGSIILAAGDRPLIYRNFFTDVSPRGIAVADPRDVNYIWDAEQMSLAKAWKNSFIDASMHWNGRGQGRQQPMGDDVETIDAATPLAYLESIDSPWPQESGRELGYRFLGYRLNRRGEPNFKYQIGDTTVIDHAAPIADPSKPGTAILIRGITVEPGRDQGNKQLIWLIGTGKIEPIENGFRVNGKTIHLHNVQANIVTVDGKQQLRGMVPTDGPIEIGQSINW